MNKSSSLQSSEDPILQWVTFKLDNETYGINVMRVQEVLRYTEIAPVPGAPSYVLGQPGQGLALMQERVPARSWRCSQSRWSRRR